LGVLKHVEAVGRRRSSLHSTSWIVKAGCNEANPRLGGLSHDVTNLRNRPLSFENGPKSGDIAVKSSVTDVSCVCLQIFQGHA
jgi:hypothetical protein